MPDGINTIWVDSTFDSASNSNKDIYNDVRFSDSENIGGYDMPVVYRTVESENYYVDVDVEYFNVNTSISGYKYIANAYFAYTVPTVSGVFSSLVDYFSVITTNSGTYDIDTNYSTGYNTVSGYLNKIVCFTGGRNFIETISILNSFSNYQTISGYSDTWINFYNNNPYTTIHPYLVESCFGNINNFNYGAIDDYVDIFFAGWVNFPFYTDVYSTIENTSNYFDTDTTVISGGVLKNDVELYSCDLQIKYLQNDMYSSLLNLSSLNSEFTTISGKVNNINTDIYYSDMIINSINLDIDLYSLKITNFSLDIGEYTSASGVISIDIEDDICPVSISGSYMQINEQIVNTTYIPIPNGYRLIYDPIDDFESLNGPTIITIHAENECGDQLENDYYLTFGYLISYVNRYSLNNSIDFGYNNKIIVRVTAENYATCPKNGAFAWEFESRPLFNRGLGASIIGRAFNEFIGNMPTRIYPQSTAYFYDKEFRVVVRAKDFSGNEMEPFILTYKIEEK